MDYEQKYKEALSRAKEQLDGAKVFDYDNKQTAHNIRTTVCNIFPELKESDDERISKEIERFLKQHNGWNKEWIDWLEKQGEQKTIEIPFGAKDSELQEVTYYIPEGYHAEINGNEVVIKKGKQQQEQTSDHWQDVRERAAIAAMQGLLAQSGDAYTELVIATEAVIYADALVEKLKGE